MRPSFHEYPLGAVAGLAYTVRSIGVGISAGGGLGFLIGLAAAITLNEAFIDLWYELDGDPIMRSIVPLMFIALIAGILVYGIGDSFYNISLGRRLAKQAALTPERVPAAWQRAFLTRTNPLTGAYAVLWTLFGSAALFVLLILAVGGGTRDDEIAFVSGMLNVTIAVAIVTFAAIIIVARTAGRAWIPLVSPANGIWNTEAIAAAANAESARRPRGGDRIDLGRLHDVLAGSANQMFRIGVVVTLGGSAIGMIGVSLRKPCRLCEKRFYDSPIEALIDNLAVIGATIAAIGLLMLIANGIARASARLISDNALRSATTTHDGRRMRGTELAERLLSMSIAEALAIILAAVGTAAATAGLSFLALGLPLATRQLIWFGLGLVAFAGILSFVGIAANLRFRNRLREHWVPGDVAPIQTTPRKRPQRRKR